MEVKVLLDSINPYTGTRLTTLHCVYPQFIHQQVLTHRMFSRNSSSLRAISFSRAVDEFETVYPIWTLEQKGMQGNLLTDLEKELLANESVKRMHDTIQQECTFLSELGIHHQDINNYLRPFQNIHTVITATDWDNFFEQRLHESTKPDMQYLAFIIKEALEENEPVERITHLPMMDEFYDTLEDCWSADFMGECYTKKELYLISAARLARISYFKYSDDPNKDLVLAKKLLKDKHLSPFEHIAFAQDSNDYFANFKSWKQLRHSLS